jgi:tRNA threonylcarbamoyladenosine biosynthesis protein TsaE
MIIIPQKCGRMELYLMEKTVRQNLELKLSRYFGVSNVKSPTYTVLNEYRGNARIHHFDFYRITDGDDLYSIGYDDYIEADGYAIVEWSENIEYAIPEDAIYVTIERVAENENYRKITVEGGIFNEDTCV